MNLWRLFTLVLARRARSEVGMTTAELLGNAALGVLALVVIWGLLQSLGVDIVNWMRSQLL
jgi:cytochrome b